MRKHILCFLFAAAVSVLFFASCKNNAPSKPVVPAQTATVTATASYGNTDTATATPSMTETASETMTYTLCDTATETPTHTVSPSFTVTPTNTTISWIQAAPSAAFGYRYGHSSYVLNGRLWVVAGISGGVAVNSVYSSADGIAWDYEGDADFEPRGIHVGFVYDNKMWVIGGMNESAIVVYKDAWYSENGTDWQAATRNAEFGPRRSHAGCAHNGKMWVIGSVDCGSPGNDVWSSTDGVTWTQVTAAAGFSGRGNAELLSYNGKMYIICGYPSAEDVWSSVDGTAWVQETTTFPDGGRFALRGVVFQDKMWAIAGVQHYGSDTNTVFTSLDGATWEINPPIAAFTARNFHTCEVFNNRIWILGGAGFCDVWRSE